MSAMRQLEDCWSNSVATADDLGSKRQRKRPATFGSFVEEPDSPPARRRAATFRPDGGSLAKRRR